MLQDSEFARRGPSGIEIRPGPIRLRWELTNLATSDGHVARGNFTASLRALPDRTELKMLEESLLGSRSVASAADVTNYFAASIITAAQKYAQSTEAQSLLSDETKKSLAASLMQAAAAVAFGCGIEILSPGLVDLECPTMQRQRMEELDRQAAERRAADQVDQLRRSAELFRQFESVRNSAPQLSAGQVLSRMSTGDQADVLRAVFLSSAQSITGSCLWAVAGNSLLKIETREEPAVETIPISPTLGPLRSIRADGAGALLLGCQTGIIRFDPNLPAAAREFHDPEVNSRLGFNAALTVGGQIWATHGEAGLVCWNLSQTDKPIFALRPSASQMAGFSPRNLTKLDNDRMIFSSAGQLGIATSQHEISPIGERAVSDVIAILVQGSRIITTHSDGQLCVWTAQDHSLECRQRRAGKLSAAAVLPWMDDARFLLAGEEGPILCVGTDDELLTQYTSPYSGIRIAATTASTIAAVTADRQRLILWRPWDPKKPFADLFLYGLARHRIADIAFT